MEAKDNSRVRKERVEEWSPYSFIAYTVYGSVECVAVLVVLRSPGDEMCFDHFRREKAFLFEEVDQDLVHIEILMLGLDGIIPRLADFLEQDE